MPRGRNALSSSDKTNAKCRIECTVSECFSIFYSDHGVLLSLDAPKLSIRLPSHFRSGKSPETCQALSPHVTLSKTKPIRKWISL